MATTLFATTGYSRGPREGIMRLSMLLTLACTGCIRSSDIAQSPPLPTPDTPTSTPTTTSGYLVNRYDGHQYVISALMNNGGDNTSKG